MLVNRASEFEKKARDALKGIQTVEELAVFYTNFLGKKSPLNDFLKSLKDLSPEEKKKTAPLIQKIRTALQENFEKKQKLLKDKEMEIRLASDWIDVTKEFPKEKGSIHPISQVQRRIEEIFTSMGFEIADGPEVETEWRNFDALNIPASHPARDMQDTFWVSSHSENSHENSVLRTHTSSVQIRKMMEHGAPLRVIVPGRVYRNEAVDASHDATFYQVEGLLVDKGISLAHLKGTRPDWSND